MSMALFVSIKELKAQIASLKAETEELRARFDKLEAEDKLKPDLGEFVRKKSWPRTTKPS